MVASPSIPNVFFSWVMMCASSALRSSALDGMQPTLRHTPPQYFSSTIPTFLPSWAAPRIAATYPPGPAPRTRTSKWVTSLTPPAYPPSCPLPSSCAALRRLRDQPRPGAHGRALPALTAVHHRVAEHRLAAHLRRRGHGLDGALSRPIVEDPLEQVFVAVYDVTREDEGDLDGWEAADSGLYRGGGARLDTDGWPAGGARPTCWTRTRAGCPRRLPRPAGRRRGADAPVDYVAALRRRPCRSNGP